MTYMCMRQHAVSYVYLWHSFLRLSFLDIPGYFTTCTITTCCAQVRQDVFGQQCMSFILVYIAVLLVHIGSSSHNIKTLPCPGASYQSCCIAGMCTVAAELLSDSFM